MRNKYEDIKVLIFLKKYLKEILFKPSQSNLIDNRFSYNFVVNIIIKKIVI